ncbi:MAG TPA: G1 family glutamic endopeptidase [Thermoleophilaceae bacterium]|nr:G1 family glutamic endopeptidase [Thermoleophilaceae bacterium]
MSSARRVVLGGIAVTAAVCAGVFGTSTNAAATVNHGALRVASAPDHKLTNSSSSNWSGYAVTGGTYTSVSASWVQPSVNCSVTPTGWSSFWVGLDGDTTNTVEQTGSEADCSSGTAVYSAWYEMYPKYPVNYRDTVNAGDHFSASVTSSGRGSFTLVLSDTTQGWSHTTTARLKSARLGSAEVIAEAPSSSGGVLPLADFGTVGFSNATANGTPFGSLSGLDRINMVSGSTTKASTSSISGGNFSVTWQHS